MRKLLLVATLLVSVSVAMAQSKVDTKRHCPKATTEYKLAVGDVPEHIYWIGQGTFPVAHAQELALPNMFPAGAVNGIGRLSLD